MTREELLKNWENKGCGYVLLYGIAMDNSIRTSWSVDLSGIDEKIKEIEKNNNIGFYAISIFETNNYFEKINK
jgi:hypothetical protein